jgi:hypothetical protein
MRKIALSLSATAILISFFSIYLCFATVSCKDATTAQYNALNRHHIIKLYSASGSIIGSWESTGSVSNEGHSDGWYFEDVKTGKLVEISGTVIITVKSDDDSKMEIRKYIDSDNTITLDTNNVFYKKGVKK